MYALVVLSFVALVLLISARRREGLAFNDKITEPVLNEPWFGAAIQKILPMISNEMNAYVAEIKAVNPDISDADAQRQGTFTFSMMLYNYSNTNYRNATTPITISDIDAYLQANPIPMPPAGEPQPPASFVTAVNNLRRAAMKAYFIDQTATTNTTTTPTGTPTPNNNAPSPTQYPQLKDQFDAKKGEYDTLIATLSAEQREITAADMARLQTLNREMFALLEKMIQVLSVSQPAELDTLSRELSESLSRIEKQYVALSSDSDRAETLRRIREFEEVRNHGSLNFYLILLLISAFAVFIAMVSSS